MGNTYQRGVGAWLVGSMVLLSAASSAAVPCVDAGLDGGGCAPLLDAAADAGDGGDDAAVLWDGALPTDGGSVVVEDVGVNPGTPDVGIPDTPDVGMPMDGGPILPEMDTGAPPPIVDAATTDAGASASATIAISAGFDASAPPDSGPSASSAASAIPSASSEPDAMVVEPDAGVADAAVSASVSAATTIPATSSPPVSTGKPVADGGVDAGGDGGIVSEESDAECSCRLVGTSLPASRAPWLGVLMVLGLSLRRRTRHKRFVRA
jgi:hypothetical protein